jgi:hypothetical protein
MKSGKLQSKFVKQLKDNQKAAEKTSKEVYRSFISAYPKNEFKKLAKKGF